MTAKEAQYIDPDMEGGQFQYTVSSPDLVKMEKERQIGIMRHWFYQRYEDPVHSMPYDSAEGGYAFLNGGPFDAREILEDEFSGIVAEEAIEELTHELEMECIEWTRTDSYDQELFPREEEFYEVEAALDDQKPLENLKQNLSLLRQLLAEKDLMDQSLHKFQLMMIYTFCVTSLEAYLSDMFVKKVMSDKELKKKYLQSEKKFGKEKIRISQIFEKYEGIDAILKKQISNTIFHNLAHVKGLFKGVFNADMGDIGELAKCINKRHDFVHRGGKDKDGNEVTASKLEAEKLISVIEAFYKMVDRQINPRLDDPPIPF